MGCRKLVLLVTGLSLLSCQRSGAPFSPQASLAKIKLDPAFRIELLAAEPLVASPVAMDIDENGRIFVVEDPGYPLDTESRSGKVKLLLDNNGDGRPDSAQVFASGLVLPTGVLCWKKGILVTDAPDLWYFEDTNNDGVADLRRKVLTGFAFTNPQHTVNSPLYGLDNWIYLAHENATTAIIYADKFGDKGSAIRYADRTGAPLAAEHGRNIRFRPGRNQLESLSGASQFGHAFDDYGRHFTLNNTFHARHQVIAGRYLKRNPDLLIAASHEEISDHGTPAKVFPIANVRVEMLSGVGEFTSACGLTLYNTAAFGDAFRNSLLVAEPAHNLVHRDILKPHGATFRASRIPEKTEFLASQDPWFRPVNFYTAPDGAIYLLDYYRLVIEHPEWMSQSRASDKELYAGRDRGRIYRITPAKGIPYSRPTLGNASPGALVAALAHDNPWYRRTAQRLLVDRKPAEAIPLLTAMARSHSSPLARLHALWTLEGLDALPAGLILAALSDPAPGVRENAIILSESSAGLPALRDRLIALGSDPDPRVRFQLLATLGSDPSPASQKARDAILAKDIDDRWTHIAALSASPNEPMRLFRSTALSPQSASRALLLRQIATAIGSRRQPAEVEAVLARTAASRTPADIWWRTALLDGLAAGLRNRKLDSPASQRILLTLLPDDAASIATAALRLLDSVHLRRNLELRAAEALAVKRAADSTTVPEQRAVAIGLLALTDPVAHSKLFRDLAAPRQPAPVQQAAVRAIGAAPGEEPARFLLAHWREFAPAVRAEAADAIYRDPTRLPIVVQALKDGAVAPWTLQFRHKRALIMHRDPALRAAVRPILESAGAGRAAVIGKYRPATDAEADPAAGARVFDRVCSKCHKFRGKGHDVGPDLSTISHQPKQVLLEDILHPSRAISQGFESYVIDTDSSGTLDGVMGPQTATTITLRQEEGKELVIPRREIRSMTVTNLSAMPGDLEKQITLDEMAALLAFLKAP
ncbi:MAG: c-type cytochrome [Bryobacterales bacterium]|nr:c-type cytochrome [Bryobacterales bacterium]